MLNLLQFQQEYPLLDHEVQAFFYLIEKNGFSFVTKVYLHLILSNTATASNKTRIANTESPK